MKTRKLLSTIAFSLSALNVGALTITYLPPVHDGNINSVADLNALGLGTGDQMWYNTDGGGTHQSDFSNLGVTGTDTAGFTIHLDYVGGNPLPNLQYAALKAADNYVIFSIADWAGENIDLTQNLIANKNDKFQGISHAILFGNTRIIDDPPPSHEVPDGGATAMLLGMGVLALGILRKTLR